MVQKHRKSCKKGLNRGPVFMLSGRNRRTLLYSIRLSLSCTYWHTTVFGEEATHRLLKDFGKR